MAGFLILFFTCLCFFTIFMMVRNEVVFRIELKAINAIFLSRMYEKNPFDYDILDNTSYNEKLWLFNKWRFKDFYPELCEVKDENISSSS